ncbi:MAG TPA: IclR family transcriptional regulator C-terminal domain-containing protein [Myxococcales bacterium]|nr:IclR family transcriptional regulator C-terminal domain-containing protein [Myxococcales bacterium]
MPLRPPEFRVIARSPGTRPAKAASDPNYMTSLARGLSVIRAFTGADPQLTIAEVARISGLPRAAARRCLHTLERLGYVGSDGRRYSLRPKILALGYAFMSSTPLATTLQPVLERVSERLHESCSASTLDEDEIVYIARAATRRIMSVTLNVGSRLPAYCTSMGRVLLSQLPREEIDEFLGRVRMRPITEKTITSRDTLRRVLDQVLEKGYALVDQELEIGLRSIAVPVRGATGAVIAAMNASAQASRISRREMEGRFLPVLQQGAGEVAQLFVRTGLSGSAAHSIARPT